MYPKFSEHVSATTADFYIEGSNYFNKYIELIDRAQKTIHLQTYIFEMDDFGQRVHQALIRAAQRGVKVYLLFDSVGSKEFSDIDFLKLIDGGVHSLRFNGFNLKWLYQWGRRLHHKILLIDQQQALIGGINVTTSGYGQHGPNQQLDFAVLLEGQVVEELVRYCESIFKRAGGRLIPVKKNDIVRLNREKPLIYNVRISINDWVFRRWQITRQYSSWTKRAKKEITIINSYFFPSRRFMRRLVIAASKGVRVRLILPKISDWPSYILASQYLYSYFLHRGVEIYEWKKSILHGKLATVDGEFSTLGSFNLNYTSYQQNLEMNVDFYSKEFTSRINTTIEDLIVTGCEKVNSIEFLQKSSLKVRFLRLFFYLILSVIANFSVLLTYQEDSAANRRKKFFNIFCIVAALICLILGFIGLILPVFSGTPFFVASLILLSRQILYSKKNLD